MSHCQLFADPGNRRGRYDDGVLIAINDDGQTGAHSQPHASLLFSGQWRNSHCDLIRSPRALRIAVCTLPADGLNMSFQDDPFKAVTADLHGQALTKLVDVAFVDLGDRFNAFDASQSD